MRQFRMIERTTTFDHSRIGPTLRNLDRMLYGHHGIASQGWALMKC